VIPILGVAPDDAARDALEALMQTKEYKNDFFDRAEAQGEVKGEAKSLVIVLEARGMHLTAEQYDQVMSCTDIDKLDLWLRRAVVAMSVGDVFKD
jgi:hypothetical protein